MQYAVITENDESQWKDQTGVAYHFPNRYRKYLTTGTKVVYYKGLMKNPEFKDLRLTPRRHYFGIAQIGQIYPDPGSKKLDQFAEVLDYQAFQEPVLAKLEDNSHYEVIPASRQSNYWRDGVRSIQQSVYDQILSKATLSKAAAAMNDALQGTPEALTSGVEGATTQRLVTTYERDPKLRAEAIRIHGTTCLACGFNFSEAYGSHGAGFIHVHHLKPLSESDHEQVVNPSFDMTVLCANCHAMVHRYPKRTLSLKALIGSLKLPKT